MPKCFRFKTEVRNARGRPAKHEFRCYVKSVQCKAHTARDDRRCHNNTIMGLPFCYAHTKSQLKLLVKSSEHVGHDGKGVFAHNAGAERGRVFQEGDVITDLIGEVKTNDQIKRRYGSLDNVPYGLLVVDEFWVDGACMRSLGSLINHAPASRANVGIRLVMHENRRSVNVQIVALHDINHGTELLLNWNWRNMPSWRAPRQESHRTYDCRFSETWDRKYNSL